MRRLTVLLSAVAAWSLFGETNSVPWRLPVYSLNARQMDVRSALETFGVAEGVPVIMSDAVQGVFSGNFADVPATEFLSRLATVHNLVWYYDGATIFVNASGETTSMLLDLRYMKAADVLSMLRELGVEDSRFPIKTAQDGELIMVSGPPRYVQLVAETIARADRLKESRTFNEVEVRLFPLVHTWADDTTFSVSTPESPVTIRGVAHLLDEIMNGTSGTKVREGTNDVEKAERFKEEMSSEFRPLIRPENRLNAVVVRDVVTRMPMYERLVRQLDVPQKLVEIGVTAVELSKKDALDWQLSLSVRGSDSRNDVEGGSNVNNLMVPGALEGMGAAAAYSYVGKHVDVNASISALKQNGKARNISRTSLITLNNIAASLSDTHTYQARVVGERVASLESVMAGTTLRIKPRIVEPTSTNASRQVWLSLELRDGGFESVAIDNLPMTSSTELQTLAAVYEGDSLLLAGYFRDVEEDGGWGIPFLRDLPLIGWIFGGVSKVQETVQRLYVLTPHVVEIGDPDDVTKRTLQNRDLTDMDKLREDIEKDDDVRRIRTQDIDERREIRHDETEKILERRKAEIERDARIRKFEHRKFDDRLKADMEAWKDDLRRQILEYKATRARIEAEAAAEKQEEPAQEPPKEDQPQ